MIGSSDGQLYETPLAVSLGKPIPPPEDAEKAPRKPAGASKSSTPTQGSQEPIVDRTHDVPLAASALHKDGEMYGVAIDKDAPIRPEYDQYIHKHESDEFHYMKDLITNGMHPTEAYHKAHDHITPMESARVQADLGEKGLEDYKQYWRDVASVSMKKTDVDRHPDAHTTTFGLDEAETGREFKPIKEAMFRGIKGAATAGDWQPINPMTPNYNNPGGHGQSGMPWYRGAEGKPRQEIPDVGAKLTPDKAIKASEQGKIVTLEHVLDHPELYKSYPQLKDVKVQQSDSIPTNSAFFQPKENRIVVGPHESMEDLRSSILHETQHAVQKIEGFATGANPEVMQDPVIKAYFKKYGSNAPNMNPNMILDTAWEAYRHVAGEVEARNVQTRKDYPLEALKIFPPSFTQDYPYEKQLNSPFKN